MSFAEQLDEQRERVLHLLEIEATGNHQLSALIDCVLMNVILCRVDPGWIVYQTANPEIFGHKYLCAYSTSMDCKIPGENIVMLARQRARPGSLTERWSALQDTAKIAYLANDPILACRLNGLRFYLNQQTGE